MKRNEKKKKTLKRQDPWFAQKFGNLFFVEQYILYLYRPMTIDT